MSGSPDSTLDRYRTMTSDDLVSTFRELGGLERAVQAQRLQVLRVLDEREVWRADGCTDAAQWVAANDMVPRSEARAMVATAEHLAALPAITTVAEEGRLSMAQLVPLAEIATPGDGPDGDARWADDGPATNPAALTQLARQKRKVSREDAERQHRRRSFRWWKDRNGLGVRFAGLLPDDAAAIVTGAIERRAEAMAKNEQGLYDHHDIRCADALTELCAEDSAAAGRPEVVIHVPVGVENLSPTLADGTAISIDTIRRLACDATTWLLAENPDGTVAGYGRRKRIVPDKMRERLRQREGGTCAWDACERTRGLKAHHLESWLDGGPTDEDNCVLLCSTHHRLVHEGGWTITGNPNDKLAFHRPACGTTLPAAPTPANPELLRRYRLTNDDAA